MFTKYFSYVKRQWRQVSGALAVLLMFMVPATRAVLAGNNNSTNHNNYQNNSQNQASRASCSTPKPVSPVSPNSETAKNSSKAPWEK